MDSTQRSASGIAYQQLRADGTDPVVLIGGYGEPMLAWEFSSLPQRISDTGRRVIWYAARGVAPSVAPQLPWAIDDLVEDLLTLLDELGIEKATLVGYSLGGFTAHRFAQLHPERLQRVVLMGSAGAPSAVAKALTDAEVSFAHTGGVPPAFGRLTTLMSSLSSIELTDPAIVEQWVGMLEHLPDVWASLDGERGQAEAAQGWIHGWSDDGSWPAGVELGIIAFEWDILCTARSAREFAERRSQARLRVIDGVGHAGLLTAPEPTIDALMDLIAPP